MSLEALFEKLRRFLEEEARLRDRAIIKLRFKPSPLRVGSGAERGAEARLTIAAVEVNGVRIPVIPGSSWRGALRRIGEAVAKASLERFKDELDRVLTSAHYEPEESPITHYIDYEVLVRLHEELRADSKRRDELARLALRFVSQDALDRDRPDLDEYSALLSPLCPICRLFGGPGLRSKLTISDTLLNAQPFERTHVSLDRMTGVREEGRLFTVEYALPRGPIELEMVAHNVSPGSSEALILAGVLDWVSKLGLEVGGFKSRGVGQLELEGGGVIFIDYGQVRRDRLIDALVSLDEVGERLTVGQYVERLRKGE